MFWVGMKRMCSPSPLRGEASIHLLVLMETRVMRLCKLVRREEVPEDVSTVGLRGTLKSLPRIRCSSAKSIRLVSVLCIKVSCLSFGA